MSKKFILILVAVLVAAGLSVFGLTKLSPASPEATQETVSPEPTASPSASAEVVPVATPGVSAFKSSGWTAKTDGKYLVLTGTVDSSAPQAQPIVLKATFISGDEAITVDYGVVAVTPGKDTYSFVVPDKDFTKLEVNVESVL